MRKNYKKFIFEVKEGNLKWEIQNTRKKKGNLDYKNQEKELNKRKLHENHKIWVLFQVEFRLYPEIFADVEVKYIYAQSARILFQTDYRL